MLLHVYKSYFNMPVDQWFSKFKSYFSAINIAPLLIDIDTCDLPSTIVRKFAYAADLTLLHSSMIWKSRHDCSFCVSRS